MGASKTPLESVAEALAGEDVATLQALAASDDKPVSKDAKRALHRLRSRGIAIPDTPRVVATRAGVPAVLDQAEPHEPVHATTSDSRGDRAIFVPVKIKLGFRLYIAILSDESGVISVESDDRSRKQVRATLADLPVETRELLREVTPARAAALVARALEMAPQSAAAGRANELLRALPTPEATLSPDEAVDESHLRDSARLFETVPFRGYLPPRETLMQVSQQLEEVRLSPLLIDQAQRLAQLRHALERATAEFFTTAARVRYAARLSDAAEFFDARDQASAARARAAAAALRSERPIHEIPFARDLFERIFDLQAAANAAAVAPPAPEPVGVPSGLILP